MLKKKFLAKNVIYISTSHSKKQINSYLQNLHKIFNKIGDDISGKKRIKLSNRFFDNKKEISLKRLN